MTKLKLALKAEAESVDRVLDQLLEEPEGPEAQVVKAMRYSALGGGKRIRPFLVMMSARLFGVAEQSALRVAAALEMVHCYSLIHDDLPAMDDDDLRRGRATCHIEFDEATAILAGDALLTRAFEVLAEEETHSSPQVRCELISELAKASGMNGMVGGQMIDLMAETRELGIPEITRLQRLKTGALIVYACRAGAILGKAEEVKNHALRNYGHDLGLAFQIADDLLDVEASEEETGKKVGKDAERGKATFVSLLGIERAREQALMLSDQACSHLDLFDRDTELLRVMAKYVVNRRS
ncbi:geranyltranstransferase [Candidatus Terasakiella magnetica]|uniref:Geranyltranstransferase n=1 Tax=Candidatus Terasakiella magnetica TaxID=1867952 RepID=A0A1C3RKB0_9PROT|nr:farnesyl diphosphate synthase [Candidatus Terasakiella magnetica]SCA57683.1 geranyltranstransferase [Candidatus Terasakiella magnetica]